MALGEGEFQGHHFSWDIVESWDDHDDFKQGRPDDLLDAREMTVRVEFDDGDIWYFDVQSEDGWDYDELFSEVYGGLERGSGSPE